MRAININLKLERKSHCCQLRAQGSALRALGQGIWDGLGQVPGKVTQVPVSLRGLGYFGLVFGAVLCFKCC